GRYAATAASALLACSVGGLVAAGARPQGDDSRPPAVAPPKGEARAKSEPVVVQGRVVGPGGEAGAGARGGGTVPIDRKGDERSTSVAAEARSEAAGRFRVEVPSKCLDGPDADPGWRHAEVIARADGFGPAWVTLEKAREREPTLRLVRDDVPLR